MSGATLTLARQRDDHAWPQFDVQLLLYAVLLIGVGLVAGISASYGEPPGSEPSQTSKTLVWSGIGLTLFAVAAATDYRWLRSLAVPGYVTLLALLLLTAILGSTLFGARMSVSLLGLDFQFSEIGKVLLVAVMAAFLASRGERVSRPSTVWLALAIAAPPTLLVFAQPDLGTALVFAAVTAGLLFLAGASLPWLASLAAAAVAATPLALALMRDYQRERLLCFLDPSADPQGACYQLSRALEAVAAGGTTGRGFSVGGEGVSDQVPVQTTDFVFTIIAEDFGLAGGVVLLVLFGLLLWRILRIAWRAHDGFARLFAAGMATVILFQVVVNVGMVIGLMPVTGIPLPFVTYGGSSLVSLMVGLGILESVRMRSHRPDR